MAGYNPDAAQDDLETAVAEGAFPAFELWVQIMGCQLQQSSGVSAQDRVLE